VRHAVRTNVLYGVDVIKIAAEDDVSAAEMAALVDEAHREGLKVAVHVKTPPNIQIALDAGADSIEHGDDITDAQLSAMRAKGSSSTSPRLSMVGGSRISRPTSSSRRSRRPSSRLPPRRGTPRSGI
jgi:imidazolonepropionase-like amidohydrolase